MTDRQDKVDNEIHNVIHELIAKRLIQKGTLHLGETLAWNIEEIGPVRDALETIAVNHGLTSDEFYP